MTTKCNFLEPPQCPSGDFECGTGSNRRCVQTIHLCDGQSDCPNSEDENLSVCGMFLS